MPGLCIEIAFRRLERRVGVRDKRRLFYSRPIVELTLNANLLLIHVTFGVIFTLLERQGLGRLTVVRLKALVLLSLKRARLRSAGQ